MHEYRAMTMFSGIPSDGVSNDTLMEIKEWTGPYLSCKQWKEIVLFSLQLFEYDVKSRDGHIKCFLYRDNKPVGLVHFTHWTTPGERSDTYAYLYSDPKHRLRTLRVYSKEV